MSDRQRQLAVDFYNQTWALVDRADRTPDQDRDMLAFACASRSLWRDIGGPEQWITGDWQVGHVAALLGLPDLALGFSAAAHQSAAASDVPLWLKASTCEGLARAHAVAGDREEAARWMERAHALLSEVPDPDDRAVIEAQLSTIPRT